MAPSVCALLPRGLLNQYMLFLQIELFVVKPHKQLCIRTNFIHPRPLSLQPDAGQTVVFDSVLNRNQFVQDIRGGSSAESPFTDYRIRASTDNRRFYSGRIGDLLHERARCEARQCFSLAFRQYRKSVRNL